MILRREGDMVTVKSEWSPRYYKNIFKLTIVFSVLIFSFFLWAGVLSIVDGKYIEGILWSAMVCLVCVLISKTAAKEFSMKKVHELKLTESFVELHFFSKNLLSSSIKILRTEAKITFKVTSGIKDTYYVITILDGDNEEYIIRRQHGLWWSEDVIKIYDLFTEYRFKRRKKGN